MKQTQYKIAELLGTHQPIISMIITGKRQVPWRLAKRLSEYLPGRDIISWKNASPDELKKAFKQLPIDGDVA